MADVTWIKLYVGMFGNKKIKDIRRTYKKIGNEIVLIWVMLLDLAGQCNDDGTVKVSSDKNYTLDSLADELRFTESEMEFALGVLQEYKMIAIDDDFVISIVNWEEYQNVRSLERIREQDRKRSAAYRERKKASRDVTGENKSKNREEEKEIYSVHCENCTFRDECSKTVDEHFDKMWEVYPLKKGKSNISKTQKNKLYKLSVEEMHKAIERYKEYVQDTRENRYNLSYKNGSTFFNSGYLDYLDDSYEIEDSQKELQNANHSKNSERQ